MSEEYVVIDEIGTHLEAMILANAMSSAVPLPDGRSRYRRSYGTKMVLRDSSKPTWQVVVKGEKPSKDLIKKIQQSVPKLSKTEELHQVLPEAELSLGRREAQTLKGLLNNYFGCETGEAFFEAVQTGEPGEPVFNPDKYTVVAVNVFQAGSQKHKQFSMAVQVYLDITRASQKRGESIYLPNLQNLMARSVDDILSKSAVTHFAVDELEVGACYTVGQTSEDKDEVTCEHCRETETFKKASPLFKEGMTQMAKIWVSSFDFSKITGLGLVNVKIGYSNLSEILLEEAKAPEGQFFRGEDKEIEIYVQKADLTQMDRSHGMFGRKAGYWVQAKTDKDLETFSAWVDGLDQAANFIVRALRKGAEE